MPDYLQVFEQYRRDLLGSLRQITDDEFKVSPGGTANSAAVIIQHLSGNLASRFTDFLTSDGEKPWREREAEFQASERSRQELMEEFERARSEEHTSELQSRGHLVCRLLLEKKKERILSDYSVIGGWMQQGREAQ